MLFGTTTPPPPQDPAAPNVVPTAQNLSPTTARPKCAPAGYTWDVGQFWRRVRVGERPSLPTCGVAPTAMPVARPQAMLMPARAQAMQAMPAFTPAPMVTTTIMTAPGPAMSPDGAAAAVRGGAGMPSEAPRINPAEAAAAAASQAAAAMAPAPTAAMEFEPAPLAVMRYRGCYARFHKTRGTYSIYCPVGWVAPEVPANGFFGAFGAAEDVTPPAPAGTIKVADEAVAPPEAVSAGTEDTKVPLYKRPWFWAAMAGGAIVVGGGSYALLRK